MRSVYDCEGSSGDATNLNGNANNSMVATPSAGGGGGGAEVTKVVEGNLRRRHSPGKDSHHVAANRMRVVKMLFVVVLEFFICWTPLYVLNTWLVFDVASLRGMDPAWLFITRLLSYSNSFTNPITYCFMSKKFRKHFLSAFGCGHRWHHASGGRGGRGRHRSSTNTGTFRSGNILEFMFRCVA